VKAARGGEEPYAEMMLTNGFKGTAERSMRDRQRRRRGGFTLPSSKY